MKFEHELKVIRKGVEEIIPEEELIRKLEKSAKIGKPLRVKYGIDPTGFDVHIGHLVPIRKMPEFQDLGHIGVIIIGDFTAQIGDPTGRDESRPPLTAEMIIANSEKYMEQLFTVLDPAKTEIRWQSEWFGPMGMTDVLKLMGKFTLAQFMAHDTFRNRYEQGLPLGMHEIMYPILQSYDSVAIEADIELGATEQKFNILCGRDMQRCFNMEQQIAVLSPILIGTDGVQKMSKSFGNYIAVFDPPNEKFGKVMSIPDSLILNYFNYATKLDPEAIEVIQKELNNGANPMIYKKQLAREIVKLYHGEEAAQEAQTAFEKFFSKREIPDEVPIFSTKENSSKMIKVLVDSKMCASSGEARRMIQQNAVTLNGEKWVDFDKELILEDGMIIKVGKRKLLKIVKTQSPI
ncbi:MAG: tyrosine--tRNA ligase [Candidatus Cloacimonadaceae bacterium]